MNLEEYKKRIYHPKSDNYKVLGLLKQEGNYEKIRRVYRQISIHPFVKSVLNNNSKPIEYSDLRKQIPIPFSGNFVGEASFYLIALENNKEIISDFIIKKEKFDCEVLLGNYKIAEEILEEVEKKTGKSIWLIESQILLKEYKDGVKANWNEVSELSKKITDPFVLFLLENLSKRAESKTSYFRYLNIFNNQINETLINRDLFDYLCFRLNYLGFKGYQNFAFILFVESSFSIIDRYLMLKEVLSEMLLPQFKEQRLALLSITQKLYDLFPLDNQVVQILNILDPTLLRNKNLSNDLSEYLKHYSIGNYNFCIEKGLALILKYPNVIETYEIYVKSHIELGIKFDNDSIPLNIKSIISILKDIYTNEGNIDQSIDLGLKISITFSSSSWAKQFLSLIKSSSAINNGNKHFTIQYLIYSKIINPRILYYIQKDHIEKYTILLKEQENLLEPTKILNYIIEGNYRIFKDYNSLPSQKRDIYFGRAIIQAKEFEEAKDHFKKLYDNGLGSSIYNEEILVNLFRCYVKLNLNEEACRLFVENYLINKGITKRFDISKLLNSLEKSGIENVQHLIELPIFYRIASDDAYQQYVAYDMYLESHENTRPTEIFNEDTIFDNKLIFFLKEVCTIEIMHYSYHFNGTDDIESERLNILNKLIVNDSSNEDDYIKEITELSQNFNIRKAIREVNKGRITVNVQQLRNIETNNIKEAFNRYKEIESYSKTKEITGIDSSLNMLKEFTATINDIVENKATYSSDPAFISFKVIFIEMRDKFILSKEYGLDGYLSTRIRHGTLLNHIRSVFESGNIISQRDKNNDYLENDFWGQTIPYPLIDKNLKIQNAIKKFSRSIDEYTEYIVKELIQVKTEKYTKKSNALFDFSISNHELLILFSLARGVIKDHNIFLSFVFEYLESVTERLLSAIRIFINEELKNNYNKILQDFNTEIKNILGDSNYPELTNAIGLCGTRLQNELKNISEWFYLSNSSKDLSLELKVLIQTSIQITNTIHPNYRINPVIKENISNQVVGTIHLIYICRILLDNIIIHSKLPSSEVEIEILTQTSNDFLEMSFKSNFSESINVENLMQILDKAKQKWESSSNDFENIDIEGGSGFEKIRRIIVFDLGCENYKFDYKIVNNFITISLFIDFLDVPKYDTK